MELFGELPGIADIEVVIALLPEVFLFADQSPRYADTPCFNDLIASASVPRSGSPASTWTCSGITTYPYTQRSKLPLIRSNAFSNVLLLVSIVNEGRR